VRAVPPDFTSFAFHDKEPYPMTSPSPSPATGADTALDPNLQQLAETWLKRPLQPQEFAQLQAFQAAQQSAGVSPGEQAAAVLALSRANTQASVRDSLSAIHSNVTQAMQAQEKEEQAILKVVEGARSLAELRPSALNGGTGVGMGGQMALSQIADRLAGLARQEVERCFNQTFMPLQNALSGVVDRLNQQSQTIAELQARQTQVPTPAQATLTPAAVTAGTAAGPQGMDAGKDTGQLAG
jgi:hypothetical protein